MICTPKLASIGAGTLLLLVTMLAGAAEPAGGPIRDARRPDLAAASPTRTLELRAPPITRIFTAQQIEAIMARTIQSDLESVQVEAPRLDALPFDDASASVPAATFQAVVRWLAPYPAVVAARVNRAPDVTDSYRPLPVSLSAYSPNFIPPYSQR